MAETLRELVVALSLDSSNFSRNMRTINAQIKEAESAFCLAGAGVENFEKTIKGSKRVLLNTVRDLSGTIGAAFTGLSVPEIGGAQLAMAGAGTIRGHMFPFRYDRAHEYLGTKAIHTPARVTAGSYQI